MNFNQKTLIACACIMMQHINAEQTPVVVIFGQDIMQKSKYGIEFQKRIEDEQRKGSAPLQADEQKIRSKEQDLISKKKTIDKEAEEIANSKILSQEAKQRKFEEMQDRIRQLEEDKAELERLAKRLQADAKRFETKMTQISQEEMAKIDAISKEVIEQIAKRENWDIVEMRENVLYASPRANKTSIVITELDAHFSKNKTAAKS